MKLNTRILAGGSLGILSLLYIRVVNSLLLSIFHNTRNRGGEKWEAGEGKRQLWAGQQCFMGSGQPFFSPHLPLSKALRLFIQLARQAALQ